MVTHPVFETVNGEFSHCLCDFVPHPVPSTDNTINPLRKEPVYDTPRVGKPAGPSKSTATTPNSPSSAAVVDESVLSSSAAPSFLFDSVLRASIPQYEAVFSSPVYMQTYLNPDAVKRNYLRQALQFGRTLGEGEFGV